MPEHTLVARAAQPTVAIIRNIKADQFDAATPCSEYDVRKLINHLLFWGPSLEAAARKEQVAPPAAGERDVSVADRDAPGLLEAQLDRLVAAWGRPEAWEGATQLGSPTPLPAPMIGGMVLGEFVVHGWDLARATGQEAGWDDEVLQLVHREVAKTAEQGREMGVYGERVPVPDTASVLARTLGLTGRDPNWGA